MTHNVCEKEIFNKFIKGLSVAFVEIVRLGFFEFP